MKYRIVCVRDRAADCFGAPNFVLALGSAIRSFADECNRNSEGNALYFHADDFELFEVGAFNDEDCSFELLKMPRQIAIGKDLQRKENGK